MKIFFDTFSLIKLYHREEGTVSLLKFIAESEITHIYLSELSKIEFASAIWKKVRTKEITSVQAENTLAHFEKDIPKYNFIAIGTNIIEQARKLTSKYGNEGLRTLGSIQLSTCVTLATLVDKFFTSDKLLANCILKESLNP